MTRIFTGSDKNSRLFWTSAVLALGLAIAVALATLLFEQPASESIPTAAQEIAAREARIAFFEQRAAADPLDFLSLNQLAGQYLQRARETGGVADYELAELVTTRSRELVPTNNFGGLIGLASVRLAQHDFAAAEKLALQAVALKPYEADAYGLLSDALIGLGRYDAAEDAVGEMVRLDPSLPALSRLANLAFLRGDRINAVVFWRQAIELGQGLPSENLAWARVQLGITHFALGDLSQADSEYKSALALYPEYRHALAGLAQVHAARGDWGIARSS